MPTARCTCEDLQRKRGIKEQPGLPFLSLTKAAHTQHGWRSPLGVLFHDAALIWGLQFSHWDLCFLAGLVQQMTWHIGQLW